MRVDVILSYRHFWRAIDEVIYVRMPVNVRVRGVGGQASRLQEPRANFAGGTPAPQQTASARQEARSRFLAPFQEHLAVAGLGHISEIVDADPPHAPRGCPFQAWSLGEMLRLMRGLLAEDRP